MKMRNLLLVMVVALMPLAACNANGTSNRATNQAKTENADLSFLKRLGVDVSQLSIIGDNFDFNNYGELISLEDPQILKLLPLVRNINEDEIEGGYYLEGARSLPGGYVMLLYAVAYGDSGIELMGIYDKNGNLTDFMQLGNCAEFSTIECDDQMTQGKAEITNTLMTFSSPNEFAIDQTTKVADWQRSPSESEETLPQNFTKVYWLVQTLSKYSIDNQGHISLLEEKEIKRQGEIEPDRQRRQAMSKLANLPASDPKRIDRLSAMADDLLNQLNRGEFDEDMGYYIQVVLADYFDSNPQALLQWIYDNRNKKNLIVDNFEQIFSNGWRNKYTLVRAIQQMTDKNAQKFLEGFTAQWGPNDAVG